MISLSRITDHHVHTKYCLHAAGEMHEYIEAAIARGLGGIGFSMHLPADTPTTQRYTVLHEEMELILRTIEDLRSTYGGSIEILAAGEADYFPGREDEIARMIESYPLDYVIGSVHYLGEWPMDHPDYIAQFDVMGVRAAYDLYFETLMRAARTGLFDIIGHADVIKKFGHRPEEDWSDLAEEVAETIGGAGLCIDFNTSGRDKLIGEFYPSRDLLERFARNGAGFVLGSDAHTPKAVGGYFDEALAMARECGFRAISTFRGRERTDVDL